MLPYATVFTVMGAHKALVLQEGVRQAQELAGSVKPTVDQVKTACFGYAKTVAEGWFKPGLVTALQNGVAQYVAAHGARPSLDVNAPPYVAWRDAFDEFLMDAIGQDTMRGLGQDFIGEYLTDAEIDEPAVLEAAATQGAKLLVEAAVHGGVKEGRKPGQVLAEIGIVADDIAPYCLPAPAAAAEVNAKADTPIDEVTARVHVEQVIGRWAISKGVAALDPAALAGLFKPMFDDEFFLVLGPVETIGGTKDDVPFFIAHYKAHGAACVDQAVAAAFNAALSGAVVTGAAAPAAGKPKKGGKKGSPATAPQSAVAPPPNTPVSVTQSGADHSTIIALLREHRLTTDEDLGNAVGVSRATIANIIKGKAQVTLNEKTRAALLAMVDARMAGLSTARTLLA